LGSQKTPSTGIGFEFAAMPEIEIKALSASPKICEMLSELLMEAVANGGSVSFMHPLQPETAEAFWDDALAAAARDERIILGAWDGEVLAGTVTLRRVRPSMHAKAARQRADPPWTAGPLNARNAAAITGRPYAIEIQNWRFGSDCSGSSVSPV
jgi:hypothetical protein